VLTSACRVTIHALIAALCTVLACHISGNQILHAMVFASNADKNLYYETLRTLERAAELAKDVDLSSKLVVCRELYAKFREGN
jgi:hypothetical protein